MQSLSDARLASKLACLGPTGRDQVLRYLRALSARQYAPGTIEAVIITIKRLLRHLPPARSAARCG